MSAWQRNPGTSQKDFYSKTCVRQPPLKLTLVVDVERLLSYKGTCHVILLAKLHDMYLYKTDNFFHINNCLKSVWKVALLHRFYCTVFTKYWDKACKLQTQIRHCSMWYVFDQDLLFATHPTVFDTSTGPGCSKRR